MMNLEKIDYRIQCGEQDEISMRRLLQECHVRRIEHLDSHLDGELQSLRLPDLNGRKVAVTAGSRGIANIAAVTKQVLLFLKKKGADPFIVPAMGSHGGGTAEGQKRVLHGYGITEESMGVPILSDMETVCIGETKGGVPVACDKHAFSADHIVVINRVKAHTDFKAEYESGLCKMMMVGLGKHHGAAAVHQAGSANFGKLLPAAADVFLKTGKILFGVALVENAREETCAAECIMPGKIKERDRELLAFAKECQGRLPLVGADLLLIDEIGKNISGAGLDPNVIGKPATGANGFPPSPARIVAVLGLTHCSGGNAIGVGMADIIPLDLAKQIDLASTYTNALTACVPHAARIPMIANDERDILNFAMLACRKKCWNDLKVIHIKNTLELGEIHVSEKMADSIPALSDTITLDSTMFKMKFDSNGRMRRIAC